MPSTFFLFPEEPSLSAALFYPEQQKLMPSFARSRSPEYEEQDVFTSLLILLPGNVKKIAGFVHAELQKS
jgi:hypothetical protein